MLTREHHAEVESLAGISAGDDVEIVRVLLHDGASSDPLHVLRTGREWHCRFSGAVTLLLVSPAGQVASVHRDAARFIEVRRVVPAPVERNARYDVRSRRGSWRGA